MSASAPPTAVRAFGEPAQSNTNVESDHGGISSSGNVPSRARMTSAPRAASIAFSQPSDNASVIATMGSPPRSRSPSTTAHLAAGSSSDANTAARPRSLVHPTSLRNNTRPMIRRERGSKPKSSSARRLGPAWSMGTAARSSSAATSNAAAGPSGAARIVRRKGGTSASTTGRRDSLASARSTAVSSSMVKGLSSVMSASYPRAASARAFGSSLTINRKSSRRPSFVASTSGWRNAPSAAQSPTNEPSLCVGQGNAARARDDGDSAGRSSRRFALRGTFGGGGGSAREQPTTVATQKRRATAHAFIPARFRRVWPGGWRGRAARTLACLPRRAVVCRSALRGRSP